MALNHQFNLGLIKNPYFPPINLLYFKMEMEMLCNNTRIHGWNHSKRHTISQMNRKNGRRHVPILRK